MNPALVGGLGTGLDSPGHGLSVALARAARHGVGASSRTRPPRGPRQRLECEFRSHARRRPSQADHTHSAIHRRIATTPPSVAAHNGRRERGADCGTSHVQDAGESLAGNDAAPISTAVRTLLGPCAPGDDGVATSTETSYATSSAARAAGPEVVDLTRSGVRGSTARSAVGPPRRPLPPRTHAAGCLPPNGRDSSATRLRARGRRPVHLHAGPHGDHRASGTRSHHVTAVRRFSDSTRRRQRAL
jgi:hypothetical protein